MVNSVTNYANRGSHFEKLIEYSNNVYAQKERALIFKQHTHIVPIRNGKGKIVSAKICEKAIADYMGTVRGTPVAIEAKETKQAALAYNAVKPHQADFLTKFEKVGGGKSFVVISYSMKKFYCIPWKYWGAWYQKAEGKSAATEIDGWTIPKKKSVRPEDLLPEWEVQTGLYGSLHYLACMEEGC